MVSLVVVFDGTHARRAGESTENGQSVEVLVRNQEGSLRDSASLGEVLNKEKPVVSKNIPHSQPIEERLIEVRN